MNSPKANKMQLDLIISTCEQDREISNAQIKQMMGILAMCMQAGPAQSETQTIDKGNLAFIEEGNKRIDGFRLEID